MASEYKSQARYYMATLSDGFAQFFPDLRRFIVMAKGKLGLGGARHQGMEIVDKALGDFGGAPRATLIGRQRQTDALHAALINCLASSIYSFDDTHEQAVVHPSGPVVAAALAMAMAELKPVSGKTLLTAFALGVELSCRLCKALTVAPARGSKAWSGPASPVGSAPPSRQAACLVSRSMECARRSASRSRRPPGFASCTAACARH